MDSNCVEAYYNLGSVLDALGKIDESIEMYKEFIRLDPADADGYKSLATLLRRKENYEEAYGHYMKALELNPSDAFIVANGLGCLYLMQGMFVKAAEEFQKSISLNEKFTYAFWNMSLVLFCEGRPEEAEKYFEDGMKVLEEDERVETFKSVIGSYVELQTCFVAKLNSNNQIFIEEQIQVFGILIDGLIKIRNLLTYHLNE